MPTYEYVCKECGHRFAVEQRMTEARLTDCPQCGKPALERVLSASGFALKGSGWYQTDFKGGSKPSEDKGETAVPPPCAGGACTCH
ncbi:MAG: FmdB family zinc ribbon protein [Acidithiobacillus sp.]|jgi:putative FmdB family regulatory protein|uniref:FmdB family zinc ribbon protein n=1 Tax=Acidithiobacillus sp. TaxID=1872118 RepID=UPI003CFD1AC1